MIIDSHLHIATAEPGRKLLPTTAVLGSRHGVGL